jgi:hypothetical protein
MSKHVAKDLESRSGRPLGHSLQENVELVLLIMCVQSRKIVYTE